MAPKPLVRNQLIHAATTSPWTRDFRHLLPIPRKWLKRTSIRDPVIKSVRPRDRIKYWNVVPGDQIRLLGDKENTLHEVLSINRISNRIFVKGVANSGEEASQQREKVPKSKNYHYSRCQLFVGNYEFPSSKSSTKPEIIPVFAQRIGTSPPFWNPFFRRYDWQRFATKTIPVIPHLKREKIPIPWPKPDKSVIPEPSLYDTVKEDVIKVTYNPPPFTPSAKGLIPRPPSEVNYLKSLYNPSLKISFGESPPVEIYLHKELANPHSRAKKMRRWKLYQNHKKSLLRAFIKAELAALNGRSEREARADAAWKWREKLAEEKEAERKGRWKHKASEAKMERKKARKDRKEMKQRQRLTDMVLKEQPNQVIPNVP